MQTLTNAAVVWGLCLCALALIDAFGLARAGRAALRFTDGYWRRWVKRTQRDE